MQEALDAGLEGASAQYARALLAPDAEACVALLETALENDPFHFRANTTLALVLVLLGRHEEADARIRISELIFPDALGPAVLRALLHALRGDPAPAPVRVAGLDEEEMKLLVDVLDLVARSWRELETVDQLLDDSGVLSVLPSLLRSMTEVARLLAQFEASGRDLRDLRLALAVPPVLLDAFEKLRQALPVVATRQTDQAVTLLRAASARLPAALLFYLEGLQLFGCGERREALEAFREAAERPSLTGALGDKPLVFLAVCAWDLSNRHPDERDRWMAEQAAAVRRIGFVRGWPGFVVAAIALRAGEPLKARQLIDSAIEQAPEHPDVWRIKAEIELEARAYPAVLEAVAKHKELGGRHPKALEFERTARAALGQADDGG